MNKAFLSYKAWFLGAVLSLGFTLSWGQSPTAAPPLEAFPAIYTLQTGFGGEPLDQRRQQAHALVGKITQLTPEKAASSLQSASEGYQSQKDATALNLARAHFYLGMYAEAEKQALLAGDRAHRSSPRQVPEMLAALEVAALAEIEQKSYEKALKTLTVAMGETSFRERKELWTRQQIATSVCYEKMGLVNERIATLRNIYMEYERIMGEHHAETIKHHSELAGVLYQVGQDVAAERETRAVLRTTLKVFGPQHEQTQIVRKNLARVLEVQNKYPEAEELRREIVQTNVQTLGYSSLATLKSLENLLKNLERQQKLKEMEESALALVKHSEELNGPNSPTTLQARLYLRKALQEKKDADSLADWQELSQDCLRVLGEKHPLYLEVEHGIGVCLLKASQPAESEKKFLELLKRQRAYLPENDALTLETRHQLSRAYMAQKKLKEALDEIRSSLTRFAEIYGPNDPRSLAAQRSIDEFTSYEAGRRLLADEQKVKMERAIRQFGPVSLASVAERANYCSHLHNLQFDEEATEQAEINVRTSEKVLGKEHPASIQILHHYGVLLLNIGNGTEAVKILTKTFELRKKLYPEDSLDIVETQYQLGVALGTTGRLQESYDHVSASYEAASKNVKANKVFLRGMKTMQQDIAGLLEKSKERIAANSVLDLDKINDTLKSRPEFLQQPDKTTLGSNILAPITISPAPTLKADEEVPLKTIQKIPD